MVLRDVGLRAREGPVVAGDSRGIEVGCRYQRSETFGVAAQRQHYSAAYWIARSAFLAASRTSHSRSWRAALNAGSEALSPMLPNEQAACSATCHASSSRTASGRASVSASTAARLPILPSARAA